MRGAPRTAASCNSAKLCIFPQPNLLVVCSDPGGNSDPSSNKSSLGSTYVNTNLSVEPFDTIFDPTGNPVFQNETWDSWPIKRQIKYQSDFQKA